MARVVINCLRDWACYSRALHPIWLISCMLRDAQAIGRCATNIPDIASRCMHGLMGLVTSPSEVFRVFTRRDSDRVVGTCLFILL